MRPSSRSTSDASYCLWGIIIIAFVGLIAVALLSQAHDQSDSADPIGAWCMAEKFVRGNLRCPSTADFGWQTARECVAYHGKGRYTATGWVDAQNGFGAMIRSRFVCKMTNAGDNWRCTSIDITGR